MVDFNNPHPPETGSIPPSEVEIWGDVTDPAEHNPDRFRYLVHAITERTDRIKALVNFANHAISQGTQPDFDMSSATASTTHDPANIHSKIALSMSLIDEQRTGTWGDYGPIIHAPVGTIVATAPHDLYSPNHSRIAVEQLGKRRRILNPEEILRETKPHGYNEILAWTKRNDLSLKIAGFFYKVDLNGTPFSRIGRSRAIGKGALLGLPVIEIIDPHYLSNQPYAGDTKTDDNPTSGQDHCFQLSPSLSGLTSAQLLEGFAKIGKLSRKS